ncbi:hypothetical protein CQW23_19627 [Capsicum baccatum]|uniref:Uncharacterized protein n=1 Tax=Capsicum baccatum TaxID=33114 RepID=A0A2G2W6B3_CAPBA|nr:hypothetical protein CQW23_19627 [Capsicum baccatum]
MSNTLETIKIDRSSVAPGMLFVVTYNQPVAMDEFHNPNTFGNTIHRMLKLGLSIDEDAGDADIDTQTLEDPEADAEENKMEEVD